MVVDICFLPAPLASVLATSPRSLLASRLALLLC